MDAKQIELLGKLVQSNRNIEAIAAAKLIVLNRLPKCPERAVVECQLDSWTERLERERNQAALELGCYGDLAPQQEALEEAWKLQQSTDHSDMENWAAFCCHAARSLEVNKLRLCGWRGERKTLIVDSQAMVQGSPIVDAFAQLWREREAVAR